MKNKRLTIILIIFAVLTLLVVLSSTVFTASNISLTWATTLNEFSTKDNDKIIEGAEFNKNESIFFVDKAKYIKRIEEKNPYIKVIGIETVFPNRLVVHVAEREVLFALKVTDSANSANYNFVLLDKELKVLEKSNRYILPNLQNPIILEITNSTLTDLNFTVGTQAKELVVTNTLSNLGSALSKLGYSNLQSRALIKNAVLKLDVRQELTIVTNWGISVVIEDAEDDLFEKVRFGISVFNQYHDSNPPINTGKIVVYKTQSGAIEAGYLGE